VYILLQLKIERDAGRVFKGWNEGKIYFAPTYKYSFNSDAYAGETATSKKKRRTPAWYASLLNLVSLRKIRIHFLFYSKSPSVKGNIVFLTEEISLFILLYFYFKSYNKNQHILLCSYIFFSLRM
jgi:hypothetical protein